MYSRIACIYDSDDKWPRMRIYLHTIFNNIIYITHHIIFFDLLRDKLHVTVTTSTICIRLLYACLLRQMYTTRWFKRRLMIYYFYLLQWYFVNVYYYDFYWVAKSPSRFTYQYPIITCSIINYIIMFLVYLATSCAVRRSIHIIITISRYSHIISSRCSRICCSNSITRFMINVCR